MHPQDTRRFRLAAERFKAFFAELNATFLEREDTLTQVALALLGREHVLMTGPPGTAKSQIASAVLGRILDERTGAPSVFARQFTESTVQTDLVGPIDFKTLMNTGRTEHFTDEGMLGAVHAFLDEVLDGRDMLLRSTLNVLHERELKQGTRTTRGQLECALMTSNRYLSEVLEGSRETLLAFVDRVAFVNFVPRGFGDPKCLTEVLQRQVAGKRPPALRAPLTIQDLDELQAAVDGVFVPEAICSSLGALLASLDRELSAAYKADPNFLPTRYLSTRTAVRTGKILRAVCVYHKIFSEPERPLQVRHDDLALLRLTLLLAGPPRSVIEHLILHETDPRERRQLSILRTEREIFDRCLAQLPKTVVPPPLPAARDGKLDALGKQIRVASETGDTRALLRGIGDLVKFANREDSSEQLSDLLDDAVAHLLRLGLTGGLAPHDVPGQTLHQRVLELATLADGLERASSGARAVARWLRGRAVKMLDETLTGSQTSVGATLALLSEKHSAAQLSDRASSLLDNLEQSLHLRADLFARGAEVEGDTGDPGRLQGAFAEVEEELVLLWDGALRLQMGEALHPSADRMGEVLKQFSRFSARLDADSERLLRLGAPGSRMKARVLGPRLGPLVSAVLGRVGQGEPKGVLGRVEALLDELRASRMNEALAPADLLSWSMRAILGAERAPKIPAALDADSYRQLRAAEQRLSMLLIALQLAMKIAPPSPMAAATPVGVAEPILELVRALPVAQQQAIVSSDLARIERALGYLERWWRALSAGLTSAPEQQDAQLRAVVASRFFVVTQDEGALARFALEARLLAEMFPEFVSRIEPLREQAQRLASESLAVARSLAHGRSEAAWTGMLVAKKF
jgi:MoxR-like ATPase